MRSFPDDLWVYNMSILLCISIEMDGLEIRGEPGHEPLMLEPRILLHPILKALGTSSPEGPLHLDSRTSGRWVPQEQVAPRELRVPCSGVTCVSPKV